MYAHSSRWGYSHPNAAGLEFEDLLNSSPLELNFKTDDPPTYIHYNGSGSSPDLLCVSSDICAFTKRKVVEDPGSGHIQVIASISVQQPAGRFRQSPKKSWNFKKANWDNFLKNDW
ncbi:hypothetical protein AVEN_165576-1 [Araneus ventricosus]|uniref:Endonuclease/exonuclease/phosphatase domain-containing protein n=1 Tax=Araneus ventricosus TaxID=182803 RepID=A0A4Y2ELD5_ARAVE|nr:hypothetical protein AVEN_165576-1 [Araneus ventricosus]